VRRLDAVVAVDRRGARPRRREQLVEDDARAGAARAVDEAQARTREIGDCPDAERIGGGDDEALAARRETDQSVPRGLRSGR
jgi:hypothetical protein